MNSHRTEDPIEGALRAARPPRVVLVVDGEERELALRSGNGKWAHAAATARSLAGSSTSARLELRDKDGNVMGALDLLDDGDELPAPRASSVELAAPDARDERMLSLLITAQRAALEEQRVLLGPVLDSYQQLARGFAEYAAQVVELVRVASVVRMEQQEANSSSSVADAALVQLVSQLGAARPGGK
jgi:hypothetical protein